MKSNKPTLLIIEDDAGLQKQLKWGFGDYEVVLAEDYEAAIEALRRYEPSVIIQDLGLPPLEDSVEEGFRTMKEILRLSKKSKIIVVTGADDTESALRAVAIGAHDYYPKPIDLEALKLIVSRAFQMHELEQQNSQLQQHQTPSVTGFIASNPKMVEVCRKIEKLAPTEIRCLLWGESGTGKELLARTLHDLSLRREQPFVAINCAAIPETLIESELFGYEKGAFTGADKRTIGRIEAAQQGTLFLDELGDMPLSAQAKMLRFLEEREIERLGGRTTIPVDVRVITATNQDLQEMITSGEFREDLFFRVCEMQINVPPLRERGEDKLVIARHYLKKHADAFNRNVVNFDERAISAIDDYEWPGNVREMDNKIKYAVLTCEGKFVTPFDLGLEGDAEITLNLREARDSAERMAVAKALSISSGKVASAARLLGVTRPTLYDLIKRLGIRQVSAGDKDSDAESSDVARG